MPPFPSSSLQKPRLIIHGGCGNITRQNLSPEAWPIYAAKLRDIYRSTSGLLDKGETALDAATHAVTLFEDCELWNCGRGAVSFCVVLFLGGAWGVLWAGGEVRVGEEIGWEGCVE